MTGEWTVETVRIHLQQQLDDMREMLSERFNTQTKAVDAAFAAQQAAITAAAAASERRFEGINEFRAQLSDQAATLMSRAEATVRLDGLNEKVEAEALRQTQRVNELERQVRSRLDLSQGAKTGFTDSVKLFFAAVSVVIALIAAVATVMATR